MKKFIVPAVILLIYSSLIFGGNFTVNLNISYNYGTSDFFGKTQKIYFIGDSNYLETKDNRLGIGFNISLTIPIIKRVCLVPGFSYNFGHQQYTFESRDTANGELEDETRFFQIYSPEINLLYDLFRLKNGWKINLMLGLNHSTFKADAEMKTINTNFWCLQLGMGARFLEQKHFGFQILAYYKMPFDNDTYAYIGILTGMLFKL